MKKNLLVLILVFTAGLAFAGTWMPTGTLPSTCAIFTMTGTNNGDVIIADYNSSFYKKTFGSNSWTPIDFQGRKVRFLTTLVDGTMFAISGQGSYIQTSTSMIHRSTDNGATWQTVYSRNFPYNNTVGGALTVLQDGSLLAAIPVQRGPTIGDIVWTYVFKSTDAGLSWVQKDSIQLGAPQGLVTAGDSKVLMGTTFDGVYRSLTGGTFWWPADTSAHFAGTRYTNAIGKSREGNIYVAQNYKVMRSTDNGTTFQVFSTPSGNTTINAMCVVADNEIYIATDDKKVYFSNTGGSSWQLMTTGIPVGANVYALGMVSGKLYAATYSYGVFYYEPDAVSVSNGNELVKGFSLKQNYPNPFNPSTKISFSISKSAFVNLNVFDAAGKKVTVLLNDFRNAGEYDINFDASKLSAGVYFYKLQAEGFTETKKMILTK